MGHRVSGGSVRFTHFDLTDFGLFLFLSASVLTCGWAPNCNDESPVPEPSRAGGEAE